MELSYILAASKVIRDEATKKFSVIDIFQAVQIPKGIDEYPISFSCFGKVTGVQAGKMEVIVSIVHEGSTVASEVLSGTVKEGDLDLACVFNFLLVSKVGKYLIKVKVNDAQLPDNDEFFFNVTKEQ